MLNPLWKDLIKASGQITSELNLISKQQRKINQKLTPHQKNLYFSGLKKWGLAAVRIKRICTKPPPDQVIAILSIAFATINSKRYSDFTIVNQSVEAVKKLYGRKLASLTNFILRNTLKDPKSALKDEQDLVAKWNAPSWWIKKIKQQFKGNAENILNVNKHHPPLSIRVAYSYKQIDKLKSSLGNDETKIVNLGPRSLGIIPPFDIRSTEPFKTGQISIQDLSSQKSIDFINPAKGMYLLDACAAPGGKTFALASRYSSLNIVSSDISEKRLKKLETDMTRQNTYLLSKPKILLADLCEKESKKKLFAMSQSGFDYIILDVPCSGSGVVRRHPEIPWNRNQDQIKKLVSLQFSLLENAWDLLKVDGILLYSVCSIFSEEGENQITRFLKEKNNVKKIKTNFTEPSLNIGHNENLTELEKIYLGIDGFFYGVLKKTHNS